MADTDFIFNIAGLFLRAEGRGVKPLPDVLQKFLIDPKRPRRREDIPRINSFSLKTRLRRLAAFGGGLAMTQSPKNSPRLIKKDFDDRRLSYAYSQVLAMNRGLLLHAAAVLKDKRAYLFFGTPGGGKSTVAALSRDHEVIADDVAAVRKIGNGFYAYSTPWRQSGFVKAERRAGGKVAAIFFLKKSRRVRFKPLEPPQALVRMVARQIHFLKYTERELAGNIFSIACDFAKMVPAYEMEFKKDRDFWPELEERIDAGR